MGHIVARPRLPVRGRTVNGPGKTPRRPAGRRGGRPDEAARRTAEQGGVRTAERGGCGSPRSDGVRADVHDVARAERVLLPAGLHHQVPGGSTPVARPVSTRSPGSSTRTRRPTVPLAAR
nr:hypothetical protein GCM10020093_091830 [Planobispora longispora]